MKFLNILLISMLVLSAAAVEVSATSVTVAPKIGWVVLNPSFETWPSGTSNVAPGDWTLRFTGQARSTDAPFGTYSYRIAGNGTDNAMGWIEQRVQLSADDYTITALTKITGRTAGSLQIQLYNKTTDTVYLSLLKQANSEWVSTTSASAYISDGNGNMWLRIYVNGVPNTGSYWYIDSIVLSTDYAFTMDETKDSSNLYQTFVWNTPSVFANDIWITAFSAYNPLSYNITSTTVTVDGTAVESFVSGDYNELIYYDLSGLSAASHTIVVTRTFTAAPEITSDQAKWAPYLGTLSSSGVDTLHAQTPGYYFFSGGHATRFMQTGYINKVKLYVQNVNEVNSLKISIWSEDENTLDCSKKYETADLSSSLVNGLNELDFSANPIPVEEGDAYCLYIGGTWNSTAGVIPVTYSANGYSASVKWSQSPSTSNYHWMSQEGRNGSIAIEFWGNAPDAVYTGDSIMCGHVNSFAFVTQMNNLATNDNYQMVLPYKVKQLNDWTYQNVGVSGDTFPNIASRFDSDVLSRNPKYAVIEGGVNNLASQNMEAEEIFDYYKQMIIAAQAEGVIPVVIKILPAYGHVSSAAWNLKADEVADLLEDYHTDNPGFVLVDARANLGTYNADTGWSLNSAYSCDSSNYVHLNEAGHTVLAQAIDAAMTDQVGINGLVYDSDTRLPINGAVVYLIGDNYSASFVTGESGLYQFTGMPGEGIYYIQSTAKGYDSTPISMPFNYTGDPYSLNIAMKPSQSYFAPHYVQLITVKDDVPQEGIILKVYNNTSTVTLFTGITDENGVVGFQMSETLRYKIEYYENNALLHTRYLYPVLSSYTFDPWLANETQVSYESFSTDWVNVTFGFNETSGATALGFALRSGLNPDSANFTVFGSNGSVVYTEISYIEAYTFTTALDTDEEYVATFEITDADGDSRSLVFPIVFKKELPTGWKPFSDAYPQWLINLCVVGVVIICFCMVGSNLGWAGQLLGALVLIGAWVTGILKFDTGISTTHVVWIVIGLAFASYLEYRRRNAL